MKEIATNFFDKLTESEKTEIKNIEGIGGIELNEYIQKGIGMGEIAKFIFSNFDLKDLIRDAVIWDGFKILLQKIFSIVAKKSEKPVEIQIWVTDTANSVPINIALSIKKLDDIGEVMVSLKAKLETDVFPNLAKQEKGKIFWITLDKDTQGWLVKIL